MIQIRNSMFETNSSSCHIFMFPKSMGIKVPSTVVLYDTYEETKDNMPNIVFNDINWDEEYTTPFIRMLYACGVKEIKYTGKDQYVTDAIEQYKDQDNSNISLYYPRINKDHFMKMVFGTDVHLTVMEDWMVSQDAIDKEGDFEDWCSIRLS